MKHVDALSRYPVMTIVDNSVTLGFKQAQEKNEHLKAICKIIEDSDSPYDDYFLKSGILYKIVNDAELLVVPRDMERLIIARAHDRGHFAVKKTKEMIYNEFFIQNIALKQPQERKGIL